MEEIKHHQTEDYSWFGSCVFLHTWRNSYVLQSCFPTVWVFYYLNAFEWVLLCTGIGVHMLDVVTVKNAHQRIVLDSYLAHSVVCEFHVTRIFYVCHYVTNITFVNFIQIICMFLCAQILKILTHFILQTCQTYHKLCKGNWPFVQLFILQHLCNILFCRHVRHSTNCVMGIGHLWYFLKCQTKFSEKATMLEIRRHLGLQASSDDFCIITKGFITKAESCMFKTWNCYNCNFLPYSMYTFSCSSMQHELKPSCLFCIKETNWGIIS